jgi:hypothetical protein
VSIPSSRSAMLPVLQFLFPNVTFLTVHRPSFFIFTPLSSFFFHGSKLHTSFSAIGTPLVWNCATFRFCTSPLLSFAFPFSPPVHMYYVTGFPCLLLTPAFSFCSPASWARGSTCPRDATCIVKV